MLRDRNIVAFATSNCLIPRRNCNTRTKHTFTSFAQNYCESRIVVALVCHVHRSSIALSQVNCNQKCCRHKVIFGYFVPLKFADFIEQKTYICTFFMVSLNFF